MIFFIYAYLVALIFFIKRLICKICGHIPGKIYKIGGYQIQSCERCETYLINTYQPELVK